MKSGAKKIYPSIVKPLFDRIVALILIVLSLPILLVATILLMVSHKGKILFFQKRAGKDQEIFSVFKFKTLKENGNGTSPVGGLMRKLSIDELPQLFNVLKGDMSLVGPRPLLVEYLEYYDEFENVRHSVLPGITGWAQVHGRNLSDWKTRMEHDIYYVNRISFLLDCKILLLTFIQLFKFGQADFIGQKQETFIEYAKRR